MKISSMSTTLFRSFIHITGTVVIYIYTGDRPGSTHRKLCKAYKRGYPFNSKKKYNLINYRKSKKIIKTKHCNIMSRTWYISKMESVIGCYLYKSVLNFFGTCIEKYIEWLKREGNSKHWELHNEHNEGKTEVCKEVLSSGWLTEYDRNWPHNTS